MCSEHESIGSWIWVDARNHPPQTVTKHVRGEYSAVIPKKEGGTEFTVVVIERQCW